MSNNRQEEIIALLAKQNRYMTSRELAGIFSVSDRTIRSDIDAINRRGNSPTIESNVRSGYRISPDADPADLTVSDKKDASLYSEIPQTPDARCIYLIRKLLFESRQINLTSLQSQIYVSGYSIDNDLKRIRKMLEPYPDLDLVRSHECVSLQGEESSKRRFYRDLLIAEVQENFLNLDTLAQMYRNFNLIEVKDLFVDVLEEFDYSINESLFPMLMVHAATSIERMSCSNYVDLTEQSQNLEDTIEYQISRTFFDRVSKRLHMKVTDAEIGMFALVIMGRRASNYTSDFVNFQGNWLNTKKLVSDALLQVYGLFGLDFRQDDDLIAGLKMHIHGLIDRIKNGVSLEDVFLEEIKRKYPLVFEMGIYVLEFLEQQLQVKISDMESGFIALHLGAASERMNQVRKYKVVMILPHNQSFSDLCVKKISDMFRERLEVVCVFRYFEEKKVVLLDPDLILCTFPVTHNLNVETVQINLFVDSEDESHILQALNRLDKKGFKLEFASHIGELIRSEHYYRDVDEKSPQDIIHHLCCGLTEQGIVEPAFEEIVRKREEMSPTSFNGAFAIPHAFGAYARKSTIAVAQLKRPVKWGMFEVRLVMLFAINAGDQRMIKIFFDWVSDMMNHPQVLADLCASCSYEEFMSRIVE